MAKSIIQTDKKCFVCGKRDVHKHHIYFGAFRKPSEKWGCWCYLCPRHHNMSDEGVHFNKPLDIYLKRYAQTKFEELYGHEEFMNVFKINYL